jgi:phosphoribosylglycinamide formyltransferase-1
MRPARLLFLASGRGSNFGAVAQATQQGRLPNAAIVGLVCDRKEAAVLEIARQARIPTRLIDRDLFKTAAGKFDRVAFNQALEQAIADFQPDWVCLAGFMLLLGEALVERWKGKILNIHPSLLPAFKGLHAQKQALEAGVSVTGCTVHLVTAALDDGPILAQNTLAVLPGDTVESLSARLLPLEHQTYLQALNRLCADSAESPN